MFSIVAYISSVILSWLPYLFMRYCGGVEMEAKKDFRRSSPSQSVEGRLSITLGQPW